MHEFHKNMEETEEFDWFLSEGTEISADYDGIPDLKKMPQEEWLERSSLGEIEEDGLMWKYSENLADAMEDVYFAVSQKLCGKGLEGCSGIPGEYMERLGRKCEIVQSGLNLTDSLGDFGDAKNAEPIARIEVCLSEHGCVIAMVSDEQWRSLSGELQSPFADSGVRTIQVIGLAGGDVIVNDFANDQGKCMHVPKNEFCGLHGMLLEVYK